MFTINRSGWPSIVNAELWVKIHDNDDFHLFPHTKTWLATQDFDDDEKLHPSVPYMVEVSGGKIHANGINTLVYRYDKCFNLCGDYIEK